MLAVEPERIKERFKEGVICDAFLAATADYLSRTNGILSPAWAFDQDRALAEPWFSPDYEETKLFLLRDTPSAFKDKNVFIFASALNVG